MTATPQTQDTTSKEEQERNDKLKAQYTRQIEYNARNLPQWS